MIKWIRPNLGTSSYNYASVENEKNKDAFTIVDVRDLVDKTGNSNDEIRQKIIQTIDIIGRNGKVVVCCDYGMSRSNSVAVGVLTMIENISFQQAANEVREISGEDGIKIEVLNVIRNTLNDIRGMKEHSDSNGSVLITGRRGFVGAHVYNIMKETEGQNVVDSDDINLETSLIELDLLVKEKSVKTIIHFANPRIYTINQSMGPTLNMLKNVLNVCVENSIYLYYPSSWEVYSGYNSSYLSASESLPLLPRGTFGETKYLCEQLINHYRNYYGLRCSIVRFSTLYGQGTTKPRFIYNFLNKAKMNQEIISHKYSNGYPALDLLHIDDAMNALMLILKKSNNSDYNIGTGLITSTRDIAEMLISHSSSKSEWRFSDIKEFHANIAMDSKKILFETGWKPKNTIDEWLSELVHT